VERRSAPTESGVKAPPAHRDSRCFLGFRTRETDVANVDVEGSNPLPSVCGRLQTIDVR
jgi:hypothetical protein